jgi:hypothetical protein
MERLASAPVRLALFCAAIGLVLGAVTIGPFDVLVAGPLTLAAFAVVLAAALCGRGLGGRVVRGADAEDEAAENLAQGVTERHGAAGHE